LFPRGSYPSLPGKGNLLERADLKTTAEHGGRDELAYLEPDAQPQEAIKRATRVPTAK
jgi:hypothetical protein